MPYLERSSDFSLIILLLILGLGLYPLLLAGWASNRSYALTGGLRGVAQTISYEICLAVILIRFFLVRRGLSLQSLKECDFSAIMRLLLPLLVI